MTNRSGEVIPAPDADLCLAFANTRYWRGSATPTEDVRSLDDLLRWAETAERLPAALVQRFAQGSGVLEAAIALRETIHPLLQPRLHPAARRPGKTSAR